MLTGPIQIYSKSKVKTVHLINRKPEPRLIRPYEWASDVAQQGEGREMGSLGGLPQAERLAPG